MGYVQAAARILGGLGTAWTAYEGAKMIPYFTDQDQVLNDLAGKGELPITGTRKLNFLDQLRIKASGLEDQYQQYMVPEKFGGLGLNEEDALEHLLDTTKEDADRRLAEKDRTRRIREAGILRDVAEEEKTPHERRLEGLQIRVAQGELDNQEGQRTFRDNQLALQGEELAMQRDANRQAAEARLAEILALQAGNEGRQNVSLAEIGLAQQQNEIARAERLQDKAADRRQAIFMALMSLMG